MTKKCKRMKANALYGSHRSGETTVMEWQLVRRYHGSRLYLKITKVLAASLRCIGLLLMI